MENKTRTIDCTPTWSQILPEMVAVLANSKARKDSQRDILIELRRMAKQADWFLADAKASAKREL